MAPEAITGRGRPKRGLEILRRFPNNERMKGLRFLAVIIGSAVVAAGVVAGATPAAAANLLGNPGFESGALSPWSCSLGSVVATPVLALRA